MTATRPDSIRESASCHGPTWGVCHLAPYALGEVVAAKHKGPDVDSLGAFMRVGESGFPDIQWTLEEMVAEGDKVAARFTMRGTHRGTFFGVPPTERLIVAQAMNIYRLSGGQFVEEHGQPDMLGLLQQIGAVPA